MPVRYEIVPSEAKHVAMLDAGMRAGDRLEITCLGIGVRKALYRSYRDSVMRKTAFIDGEIAAMWGCGGNMLGGHGNPWLLTASPVERIPLSFAKVAKREAFEMIEMFPKLSGYVLASYEQACGLLELIGFTLSEPFPFGRNGAPFRRYTMER